MRYIFLLILCVLAGCEALPDALPDLTDVQRTAVQAPVPSTPDDTGEVAVLPLPLPDPKLPPTPILAPPLPQAALEASREAAVQESRATQNCPTGTCPQYQYQPRRRGLFGGWR
jgi:hypothetical protein